MKSKLNFQKESKCHEAKDHEQSFCLIRSLNSTAWHSARSIVGAQSILSVSVNGHKSSGFVLNDPS